MAFVDLEIKAGLLGKTVTGLTVSQPSAMTLEVASGTVTTHNDGVAYTLGATEQHTFTSDSTYVKRVFVGLIDNGSSTDLWIDEYLEDDYNIRAQTPSGYQLLAELVWFDIAANETDLINGSVYRRVYV